MGRLCSVCTHRQRRAIDAAVIEHEMPYRAVANAYGLSTAGLWRHRTEHLRAGLEEARMLDARALAMLAVGEGRRNVDTLMRLAVLQAAERQQGAGQEFAGHERPDPMFDDDPETVRRVLKMLIESGEAIPPPADEPAEYARPDRADDEDGPAPVAVPV